ncbi:helix-turn-helix transcriptional regulator [Breoghania sp.]|uniref:helix-turn-helix domain-containing protein n=1 Tax=Breoghania sp. TaxID=2065378 RepID=UPI002AA62DBA|nr:helix-turn-helix transcriptional regulator [Breoghania sp.]
MTPFSLLLQLSGMSQREAAAYLEASPSSVDKWARGRRNPPDGVLDALRDLIGHQQEAAENALDLITEKNPTRVSLDLPATDEAARRAGWHSVGAWSGMAARIVAECRRPITIKAPPDPAHTE